jgi:hypothetical protein
MQILHMKELVYNVNPTNKTYVFVCFLPTEIAAFFFNNSFLYSSFKGNDSSPGGRRLFAAIYKEWNGLVQQGEAHKYLLKSQT